MIFGRLDSALNTGRMQFLGMGLIFCFAVYLIAPTSLSADVSWLLYVTQRVTYEQKLYVDVFLVNPPLIVWLGAPPVLLTELTSLPLGTSLKAYIFTLIALSLALSAKILNLQNIPDRGLLLLALTYALAILPAIAFGQREHIMLVLCVPYLFVAASRVRGMKLPFGLIILTSVMAGVGFCIKPYFVLIPAIVELYLLAVLRRKTFSRLEPYIMVTIGIVYLALIFILTPEYVSTIIPYAQEVYIAVHSEPLLKLLTRIGLLVSVCVYGVLLLLHWKVRFRNIPPELMIFACAGLAGLLIYLIQLKGWLYHLYPALSLILIIFAYATYKVFLIKRRKLLSIFFSMPLLILTFSYGVGLTFFPKFNGYEAPIIEALSPIIRKHKNTESIFIFSTDIADGFPLTVEKGATWASRFPSLGMTLGIQIKKARKHQSVLVEEIETYIFEAVAEDLSRYKPQLVFVRTGEIRFSDNKTYDYIEDFSKNENFRREWSSYEFAEKMESLDIYRRIKINTEN